MKQAVLALSRYGSVFEAAVDLMFRKSKLTSEHKFLDIGCGIGSIVLQAAAWAGCQAAVRGRLRSHIHTRR